jgi:molybdopterin-containing oxidoreductase family iron-sulfur binding subunit
MDNQKKIDIEQMRQQLASAGDKGYWRGLEELSRTPEFQSWADDEFPGRASLPEVDRRSFLKLMGASVALAGLAGCRTLPQDKVVPYVKAPEERYPGQILQYATAMPFNGYGFGLLITSNEGRPTKAEGNPDHPMSMGSSDIFSQAEMLQLYDPDRATIPTTDGYPSTWDDFFSFVRNVMAEHKANGGAGVRLLTEAVTSPTLYAQIQALLKAFPAAKWYQYSSVNRDHGRQGSTLAFGRIVDTHYDLTKANVVLDLDADILGGTPEKVRYRRQFMANRHPELGKMNRLYSIESTFSPTGAFADHRLPVKPMDVEAVVRQLASYLGVAGLSTSTLPPNVSNAWLTALADDLRDNRGASVVVVGERQPPAVHALVHGINQVLGNVGTTVTYTDPVEPSPQIHANQLAELTAEMRANKVDTLFIIGGNPAFTAPPDIKFAQALNNVKRGRKIRLSAHMDETSALCDWHLPEAHFLEAWGDIRAQDGTTSIIQPLIAPLFDSRSSIELLSGVMGNPQAGYDLVRSMWLAPAPAGTMGAPTGGTSTGTFTEKQWRDSLNSGVVPTPPLKPVAAALNLTALSKPIAATSSGTQAVFEPDPTIYDGRYNNNGWLQELPKPLTKLSWDNAVILSPATAIKLGVEYQDNVDVTANQVTVTAPAYVLPGHPDDVVTLHLGYGRTKTGQIGDGAGVNFNALRNSATPGMAVVTLKKGKGTTGLAMSQTHHSMDGRDIIREGTFDEFKKDPVFKPEDELDPTGTSLYNVTKEWSQDNPDLAQWGMTIDLNTCTGCNACAIACQSENNISTVGKDQVQRGRIMHWIRIDRYFRVDENHKERDFQEPISEVEAIDPSNDKGALNPGNVKVVTMPVPCMHCETAPCEPVCPVAATIHSHEGLNQMVYNRCVGTRYCSNNCPYKVRRFNFYNYQFRYGNFDDPKDIPLLKMISNPDVTVRSRGVMEKCTYCVQRINRARIIAKEDNGRAIRDGEVITACQAACPSKSITFGNIADPNAAVTKLKQIGRNYSLLNELNTRPRTTYLTKVRNPNPKIPVT